MRVIAGQIFGCVSRHTPCLTGVERMPVKGKVGAVLGHEGSALHGAARERAPNLINGQLRLCDQQKEIDRESVWGVEKGTIGGYVSNLVWPL